jgi:hypothetical protein
VVIPFSMLVAASSGSVTLFETREAAEAANEKVLAWIRGSLSDLIEGDPEVIAGEVLAAITA